MPTAISAAPDSFVMPPRPRSLVYGIIGVIVVESLALHALIYQRFPVGSLVLLVVNVASLWYIVREFSANSPVTLGAEHIDVRSGRSIHLRIPFASVRSARVPEWRDIPETGQKGYMSIAVGDEPNAILTLDPAATATLPMGIRRSVSLLGLRLEAPAEFVAAVQARVE